MKRKSVIKQITASTLLLIILAVLVTSIGTFFVVKNTVVNYSTTVLERTLDAAKLSLKTYIDENGLSFDDEDLPDSLENSFDEFCNKYDAEYLFLGKPDFNNSTLYYLVIGKSDDLDVEIPADYRNIAVPEEYTEDSYALWNEEIDYEVYDFDDEIYGFERGAWAIIKDANDNKAILCLDVSNVDIYKSIFQQYAIVLLAEILIFAVLFILIHKNLRDKVLNPIKKISTAMGEYAESDGRSKVQLELGNYEEYSQISDSFYAMTDKISSSIDNIEALTQERERQRAEMQVTEKIQAGLLPAPFYKTPQFQIHAMMKPAKSVGGDLYDYFEIDKDHLLLVIADVSGKGLTACMYMSSALSLIRQLAKMGKSPEEITTLANTALSSNNPQMMFVTAFVAIYDKSSDMLTYSNAGHNLPYIVRNHTLLPLSGGKGVPLGMFDDEEYCSDSIHLTGDDLVFLYTDGVNEAENIKHEFYTTPGLERALQKLDLLNNENPVEMIYHSVQEFTEGAEQSDDITMLALQLPHRDSHLLEAETNQFGKIKSVILDSNLSMNDKKRLCLVCEEWFTNVCKFGYAADAKEKNVWFTLEITDKIKVILEDQGVKYNPLEKVVTTEEYDYDHQIGGLGKLLIVNIADTVDYLYENGKNILTATVSMESSGSQY